MSDASVPADVRAIRPFRQWFWQPPRPHGETIVGAVWAVAVRGFLVAGAWGGEG